MSKKNASKYTPEMVARMHEIYVPESSEDEREEQILQLCEEFGFNAKSIRAKLVNEGVYVPKQPKSKTGGKPETKERIVHRIADRLGVDADVQLSGLEKATKNCLLFLDKTVELFAKHSGENS